MRRIEAVTGPEAAALMRAREAALSQIAARLRTRPEDAVAAVESTLERARAERSWSRAAPGSWTARSGAAPAATELDGLKVVTASCDVGDSKQLLALSDRVKSRSTTGRWCSARRRTGGRT